MSGGTFDYNDHHISEIANEIEGYIVRNSKEQTYSPETIQRLNEAVDLLRKAAVLVHRIDYLLAGDHGEDSFHEELCGDLEVYLEQVLEANDQEDDKGITATSPEFKKVLENAPPWDGSLPSHWR